MLLAKSLGAPSNKCFTAAITGQCNLVNFPGVIMGTLSRVVFRLVMAAAKKLNAAPFADTKFLQIASCAGTFMGTKTSCSRFSATTPSAPYGENGATVLTNFCLTCLP